LERLGTPIGAYDVLIAAQARRRNAFLVTANAAEFVRVPGLKTEDWAAG
jgi:tRNA(fMet)-specific endonuclease VapC